MCLFPLHMLSASLPSAQHSFGAIHGTNKLTDEGNLPAKNKCLRLSACSHYDLQLLACSAACCWSCSWFGSLKCCCSSYFQFPMCRSHLMKGRVRIESTGLDLEKESKNPVWEGGLVWSRGEESNEGGTGCGGGLCSRSRRRDRGEVEIKCKVLMKTDVAGLPMGRGCRRRVKL